MSTPFTYGKAELLKEGKSDILFLGYGNGVGRAIATARLLGEKDADVAIVDLKFVKPLDEALLQELAQRYHQWYVFSDSAKIGGVASLLSMFKEEKELHVKIETFEYKDHFITHGATHLIEERMGITPEKLAEHIFNRAIFNK